MCSGVGFICLVNFSNLDLMAISLLTFPSRNKPHNFRPCPPPLDQCPTHTLPSESSTPSPVGECSLKSVDRGGKPVPPAPRRTGEPVGRWVLVAQSHRSLGETPAHRREFVPRFLLHRAPAGPRLHQLL